MELASHVDRHADIGTGQLGLEAFKLLIKQAKLKAVDMILETPADQISYAQTIKQFKHFRDEER